MNATLLAILTATVALSSPAAPLAAVKEDPKPKLEGDLAKVQGTWSTKIGPQKDLPMSLTIAGSKVEVMLTIQGEDMKILGEIKLNDTANPKTIDWVKFANAKGEDVPTNLGIYKFSDEDWMVCNGGPGNERPKAFKAGEQGPPNLIVLKRAPKPATDTPKPVAPKGDLAKFQGRWKSEVNNGDIKIELTIKDENVEAKWTRDANTVELKGELKLDEKATPKTVDFLKFKRSNGEDLPDNLGIYVIDGESIKICVGGGGNPRPDEFKAGENGQPSLMVLEKIKD